MLNWKSSRSPHYEDLETNVFESKKMKIKGFSLPDVEKKRLSVGWTLDNSEKIIQDNDDFEDLLVRVTRSSPGDILFDLPEDQMEGVVVGEATNDKKKETVVDSISASNEEVKENKHDDEKQADQPVCIGNEEFKQPKDRHVVEQQSENRVHVDKVNENIKVNKDEEHQEIEMESCADFIDSLDSDTIDDVIRNAYATQEESKAIVPNIGSGSECKLVEFTLAVSKREPKPGVQSKSPYINVFGSSEPVQEPKKKCDVKKKVKGLYPFKIDLLDEVVSNVDTKFNGWFEKGFKPDNK
ncbi:hypothetical protein TorRG33x02_175420 [Trema orientale]|uniref:Uncharacterized protein n=1 Tax=Trema orientale TaxID=63057 RepID=A0A2P5EMD9_TREOI|nr:hypothetical protein TorRG33x02_175420 [Trema orientale]